jgi:hypothetical protein
MIIRCRPHNAERRDVGEESVVGVVLGRQARLPGQSPL